MPTADPQRDHFSDLDGTRGALASVTMLMHYGMDSVAHFTTRGLVKRGAWVFCVDFLFVLSGFVLARSFQHHPIGRGEYFTKRIFRLVGELS
jgi:peptidoglycan/LPS O-acetylase OafA/YrhL